MNIESTQKTDLLKKRLKELKKVAVAFSGGVDSTFLLAMAREVLGENVLAITVNSPYIPEREIGESVKLAEDLQVNHLVIDAALPEAVMNNPPERCYLCKKQIFTLLKSQAIKKGYPILVEGTNADDTGDYRPGLRALKELDVQSPLKDAGFRKEEIRSLSQELGLPTWKKPAYACLLTRIPYNTLITVEELCRIEEGEDFLYESGLEGARLRSHAALARIELHEEQFKMMYDPTLREKVVIKLKSLGYEYICMDLEGYRMGSFNKVISGIQKEK